MTRFIKFFITALAFGSLAACDKADDLPYYKSASPVELKSSVAATTPSEADSANTVIVFSWSDPKLSVDSVHSSFIFELAPAGTNFSNSIKRSFDKAFSTSFTGKELNDILYGFGARYGVASEMETRVTASYANNNDKVVSNTLQVAMTPYSKLLGATLGTLFLVGDATPGGWTNPVSVPSQQLTKIDAKHYTITIDLFGGKEFLILPENGSWDHKYGVADNTVPYLSDGGEFGYDFPKNFPGPVRDGKYKIDLDFNRGLFAVNQINAFAAPANLYLVGDATPGGWANPGDATAQEFTKTADPNVFEIIVPLTANAGYLFVPVKGDWSHKFGAKDPPTPLKGTLYGDDASNIPSPTEAGTYKITVNFDTGKFWLEEQ